MSAETINPDDWQSSVIELCRPMIEELQAELDAADWCHPGGACLVRESLEQARGEAKSGRPADVSPHANGGGGRVVVAIGHRIVRLERVGQQISG